MKLYLPFIAIKFFDIYFGFFIRLAKNSYNSKSQILYFSQSSLDEARSCLKRVEILQELKDQYYCEIEAYKVSERTIETYERIKNRIYKLFGQHELYMQFIDNLFEETK